MQIVLIYSGGLDSTTLLYALRAQGHTVAALSVNYGQRHTPELAAASAICTALGVEHQVLDLTAMRPFLTGSSQTDATVAVPHGHYADETMKLTVVPNRNMLMLAAATAWAISRKADAVAYAAHGGDHAIYPDCRPAFVEAMQTVLRLCDWHRVQLWAPFLGIDKTEIVRRGTALQVPYAQTWSCYDPQDDPLTGRAIHCGQCGTDVERREAFLLAGVSDPTEYAHVAVA